MGDNALVGILLRGDDNKVEGNTFTGPATAGAIDLSGDRNLIQFNKLGVGGIFADGSRNTISRNVAEGGRGFDIKGEEAMVVSNKALDGFGFRVDGIGHTFTGNHAARCSVEGFSVSGRDHAFTQNRVENSEFDGFFVDATESTFAKNLSLNNGGFGILDVTIGGGTSGTANTYTPNRCTGNAVGDSSPPNLCD